MRASTRRGERALPFGGGGLAGDAPTSGGDGEGGGGARGTWLGDDSGHLSALFKARELPWSLEELLVVTV